MTTDQSFIALFSNASFVVQLVMLLLLAVSVVSWTIIIQRGQLFKQATKAANAFENTFWSGIEVSKLYNTFSGERPEKMKGSETIFVSGFREFIRLRKQPRTQASAVVEGAQRAMRVAMAREVERLENHLPFLATVGSVSPYVGLFGTVWGIMNAFRGLSATQQATLAMVAPGISEALVATAMGLFAAIPAVIAYNRYANRLQFLVNRYDNFLEEFTSILHRQAHAGVGGLAQERSAYTRDNHETPESL